jgi:hypothetical protein
VGAHRFFIVAVLCAITACAADRYQWNLAHAEVVARPPIARSDLEAIVRLVSDATMAPKTAREKAAREGKLNGFNSIQKGRI